MKANVPECEREEAIRYVIDVACGERDTLLHLHRDLAALIDTLVMKSQMFDVP